MSSPVSEPNSLNLEDYNYPLPENRIAQFPADKREQSRLLNYNRGIITHHRFSEIPALLPENSLLIFNETRVIPARLTFLKPSGAIIEVFLLNPVLPVSEITQAMEARGEVTWNCLVKNFKKWKNELILRQNVRIHQNTIGLRARIHDREKNLITFSWDDSTYTFSEIIASAGKVPLPPYMKREPEHLDTRRYQTVYSRQDGAVAAPTAGLHFTEEIIEKIESKGHRTDFLTLHVSSGTFQPIREKDITKHQMHKEKLSVSGENILNLLNHKGKIISVGTTSVRTLESLYWFGIKLNENPSSDFYIEKLTPYAQREKPLPDYKTSLQIVLEYMRTHAMDELHGETEIFIFPGYEFRICNGLITNFHMPKSTLILLIAAFTGSDWKKIYREALSNDYRFLSYGDSSLLLP